MNRVRMKLNFSSFVTLLAVMMVGVLSRDYEHDYGTGHGGGHGFYGYPVGRKWGYSTNIKHAPPKTYSQPQSFHYETPRPHNRWNSGLNHNQFDFGSFGPAFSQPLSVPVFRPPSLSSFGGSNSFWPSNNYFDGQFPLQSNSYAPYGYNRIRRDGLMSAGGQPYSSGGQPYNSGGQPFNSGGQPYGSGFGFPPKQYNGFGQQKNPNFGNGQAFGAQPIVESGSPFDDFGGLDGILGKEFPNYFVDLMPENFQELIY